MLVKGLHALMVALLMGTTALAQPPASTPSRAAPVPAQPKPPQLIVAIAVDQFSADLFATYRATFTGGLARLAGGVVFPSGYQSHAATETCPGHSTILTGYRPGHTGIVANHWIDQSVTRADKKVYCMEDSAAPDTDSEHYVQSLHRLRVPTLGDRLKAVDPLSRVIAVAGKDRGAMLLAGKKADETWWWNGKGFASYAGRVAPASVTTVNAAVTQRIADGHAPFDRPSRCAPVSQPITLSPTLTVGDGRFERKPGDAARFRVSPELDAATLDLAASLLHTARLGEFGHTDVLAISLSGTDIVGHSFGPGGGEMCIQLAELDRNLGALFARLDSTRLDYLVVLTADHGGHDLPERNRLNGAPDATRVDTALTIPQVNRTLEASTRIKGPLILGDGAFGDLYLRRTLSPGQRRKVLKAALALYRGHPQVQTVFTHEDLIAAPEPSGPPEAWSLLDEAKASFDPERSGDFVVLLKPRITPIPGPVVGAVATHGSPWGYDRRVPILFWRKSLTPFEQPLGVETVDILPTLAAEIGLPLPATGGPDGRCLDLHAGPESVCPAR
ncbi:alkaline phosphatase family protein [Sphingobium sufflavum]|uniref:alkaline phosphatase family protein n=1 Tax=Sphingobium sufflavum TaxID=1129547 RepID=UPI001F33FFA8|nr:alkaline phosphatase family protein [Sphingobium sufflavum]MCE7798560.1 alkaline phosphatase family protein [Sphingobium sufflavum]